MKKPIGTFALVLLAWAAADGFVAASAQNTGTRQRIDVSKLGPQVGHRVPDFTLPDQQGRERTLQSIMGPRGAMIVFVRSADWCPYCRTQLVELQGQVAALRAQGLGVAAISKCILSGPSRSTSRTPGVARSCAACA